MNTGGYIENKFSVDDLNHWHREHVMAQLDGSQGMYQLPIKKFVCEDGFEVSIQASKYHYCLPRRDNAWPYTEFELGFPTAVEETLRKYAEDRDGDMTDTVYIRVPAQVIVDLINKHGGPK